MALQIRRGTEAERLATQFEEGEPIWTTDGEKLYVGVSSTVGGVLVSPPQPIGNTDSPTFANLTVTNTLTLATIKFTSDGIAISSKAELLGYTGSRGYTGSQGDVGYVGSIGSTGFTGSQGNLGYTGSAGTNGTNGYTGSQGDLGYTGSSGEGAPGYTGSQGDIGYTGSTGPGANQTLNTNSNVIFNSVVSQDVVSAGGYPLDSNGQALLLSANTQSLSMVVSNYTAGLVPGVQVRGYGQNRPGTVTTATGGGSSLLLESSRGTPSSQLRTISGDTIGAVLFGGYDGARWSSDAGASVQFVATAVENFIGDATTATNIGARWFIRSQPLGVQLSTTSRHFDILTAQTAGSSSAPPTHSLLLGQADNSFTTLTMANGVDIHQGHGATTILSLNSKHQIFGVPFEDAAVFTASISGTTMDVTAVSSGILSIGQRVYATGVTSGTFITALGTATGGTGTYTVGTSQTVSSMTMNSGADNTTLNDSITLTFVSGRKNGASGRRNALRTGDTVGRISFNGQSSNSATGTGSRVSNIRIDALENYTGSARGSRMLFTTVNSGTTTEATRLQLTNLENLYNSDQHSFKNAAGSTPFLTINSNGAAFGTASSPGVISSGGATDLQMTTLHSGDKGMISATSDGAQIYGGPYLIGNFNTSSVTLTASGQINLQSTQILAGNGSAQPRLQGQVGLQLSAANAGNGSELDLSLGGTTAISSSGTQLALFRNSAIELQTQSTKFGNTTSTAVITSNGANCDLTLKTDNFAGAGGIITVTTASGVQIYMGAGAALANFSTTENIYNSENHKFQDSLSTVRAEFRKDYSHSDTDLFEIRNHNGTDIVAAFTTGTITLTADVVQIQATDLVGPTGNDFNIVADGTANINLNADTVRIGDNNDDATITTHGDGDLILDPHNGNVQVGTHLLPVANNTWDLGSTSSQWRSLYVSTATIYLGGNALSVAGGSLTLNGSPQIGYTGSAGTNGTNGTNGDPGAVGYTGSAGTAGATGYTGSSGNPFTGGTFTDTITTKGVNETVYNWGNVSAGTYTPNVSSGTVHRMTLTGNVTISSLANATTGSNCTLIITQDGTGSRLLTSTMKFQGGNNILSTAGTSTDIISIFYDGTTYWAGLGKGYV